MYKSINEYLDANSEHYKTILVLSNKFAIVKPRIEKWVNGKNIGFGYTDDNIIIGLHNNRVLLYCVSNHIIERNINLPDISYSMWDFEYKSPKRYVTKKIITKNKSVRRSYRKLKKLLELNNIYDKNK